jgi:hypothetical protein
VCAVSLRRPRAAPRSQHANTPSPCLAQDAKHAFARASALARRRTAAITRASREKRRRSVDRLDPRIRPSLGAERLFAVDSTVRASMNSIARRMYDVYASRLEGSGDVVKSSNGVKNRTAE